LFKSLYKLFSKGLIPRTTKIIGFARRDLNTDSYRQFVGDTLQEELELKDEFLECFYYFQGDVHDEVSYFDLKKFLQELDAQQNICAPKLFYISVRPELYEGIFTLIKKTDILHTCVSADD